MVVVDRLAMLDMRENREREMISLRALMRSEIDGTPVESLIDLLLANRGSLIIRLGNFD